MKLYYNSYICDVTKNKWLQVKALIQDKEIALFRSKIKVGQL